MAGKPRYDSQSSNWIQNAQWETDCHQDQRHGTNYHRYSEVTLNLTLLQITLKIMHSKKKPLRSVILKRLPLFSIYSKPIKIFQKFWSHRTILGTKGETRSKIHAAHPQLCNYLLTLLSPVTECLLHVNWYKFCTWGAGGDFNNYAENIRHHFTEYYYPGDQACRICATLLYDNMWNTNTIYIPWKHTYNLGTMFPAYCTSSYKSATLRPFWNSSYRYNSKWRSSSVIAIS